MDEKRDRLLKKDGGLAFGARRLAGVMRNMILKGIVVPRIAMNVNYI